MIFTIDGAYEYSDDDLKHWDLDGAHSSFKKHYGQYYEIANSLGLPLSQPPKKLDISKTKDVLGYDPTF
ncbi:MAG: hypothetical protein SGJ27_03530 [Candidatus Melainabacteria bacterium]|nr:hypothetical protein [Candidatus Melainabacteria bacterium]